MHLERISELDSENLKLRSALEKVEQEKASAMEKFRNNKAVTTASLEITKSKE